MPLHLGGVVGNQAWIVRGPQELEVSIAGTHRGRGSLRDHDRSGTMGGVTRPCLNTARVRSLMSDMAICIKRECGLTSTNHAEHPLVQEAGYTLKWFWPRRGADYLDSSMSALTC